MHLTALITLPLLLFPGLLVSSHDSWYPLNPSEEKFCSIKQHYEHCEIAKDDAIAAMNATATLCGPFRHCYWAARLTMNLGEEYAEKFCALHEEGDDDEHRGAFMQNCGVGRRCGREKRDYKYAMECCLKAWWGGELKVAEGKE